MVHINNNLCFVIMPFTKEFKNQWELAYVPAINAAGLVPYRGDEEKLGSNIIMRDVTRCIYKAKLIIADLTGNSSNVMYELGLAHSAKKPVIILTQSNDDIPFDVKHIRYLKYDKNDIKSLRKELLTRIKSTLEQSKKDIPDYFPELELMNEDDVAELKYLRETSIPVKVKLFPHTSDIFFNDKLVGIGKVTIHVNPHAQLNTISAAAVEYFEHHQDISESELKGNRIIITLEPRERNRLIQRVPMYLKYRRRDPNNPVLMRAIAQFLFQIKEYGEALNETKELLNIAPDWFLAHYLFAHLMILENNLTEAIKHYKSCISLRPEHAVGHIGLSCAYSIAGYHEEAIKELNTIVKDPVLLETCRYMGKWKIHDEKDFDSLRKSDRYKNDFKRLSEVINNYSNGKQN